MVSLRAFFFKMDRIPPFDIRHSLFDIRYLSAFGGFAFLRVSFLIKLAAPQPAAAPAWISY
jgi:hypothetical protein